MSNHTVPADTQLQPHAAPFTRTPELPAGATPWFATIVPGLETSSQAVNHVSNVEFVRWLDQLGQQHLGALGWTTEELLRAGHMWFVGRHEIDYRAEAHAGEVLYAATWVRSIRRVKSWRDTLIWRDTGDALVTVCTASTLWVHVDLETRRPVSPPHDMATALSPIGTEDAPWRVRT